jgi:benzoyl-CoA reductase subunit D
MNHYAKESKMITLGLDIGSKTIKAVVLSNGKIVGKCIHAAGLDQKASAESATKDALAAAHMTLAAVQQVVVTGAGRKDTPVSAYDVTEVTAAAKGAAFLVHSARTVIDIGAEEGRGVKTDSAGKVMDFVINEKCAAGAGSFTEAMARSLEVKFEELGPLSMKSEKTIPLNAQCAVFAESEVVSLVHAKTSKADIARAINDAIASRISSMIRRIGIEKDVVLIGGVALNTGFVDSLKRNLETEVIVPPDPLFVGALGAALVATAL